MSLTGHDFWAPEQGGVMVTATGHRCFFCEERIKRDPAWTWAGAGGQIWFHLGCAADFAARIFFDLVRWQQRSRRRFHEMDGR